MPLDQALRTIQDIRSLLDSHGITAERLMMAGALASVLFFLSLREVLSWYLRTNQVRDEVRALRVQMTAMQKTLAETRELLRQEGSFKPSEPLKAEELVTLAKKSAEPAPKKFRLDH